MVVGGGGVVDIVVEFIFSNTCLRSRTDPTLMEDKVGLIGLVVVLVPGDSASTPSLPTIITC